MRVLITPEQLAQRVCELGQHISSDYVDQDLHLVCVLRGGFVFLADLIRQISVPCSIDFLATSSYGSSTESNGVVRILKDLDTPIAGRTVLLVDDIVDTGFTLDYLCRILCERSPDSLRVCVLLNKEERREVEVEISYVGFSIPNEFVVGYGIDYNEVYRNLPYIGIYKNIT